MIPKLVPFGVDGVAFGKYFGAILEVSGCPWASIMGSGGTPGRIWRTVASKDRWCLLAPPFLTDFGAKMGTKKGAKMHPKIDQKMMNFYNIFGWILGAKMKPKSMSKPLPKWVDFLIDFLRLFGYEKGTQMVMKMVPDPIIFWNIFEFIFGMIF